jgi:orotate phosphoribosyltransferase
MLRDRVVEIVKAQGYQHHDPPLVLASGRRSHHFVDGKLALRRGADLALAGRAVLEAAGSIGADFDAVGGLTNGADHLAHAAAIAGEREWFFIRKQAKDRGTRRRVEGAQLGPGIRVLLVDDAVTTGGSILEALDAVEETGAQVVGAVALVDRDNTMEARFAERGVPYTAIVTYRDLGIPPVSEEPVAAEAG